jgi:AraC-like DNA-binding protein
MQNYIEKIRIQLKENLLKIMPEAGNFTTPVNGVGIYRRDHPEKTECFFYSPVVTVMVQGHKRSIIGSEEYLYGENKCLIIGLDVPSISYITDASPDKPLLGISVFIDRHLTAQLASENFYTAKPTDTANKTVAVFETDADLLDAFLRLSKLFDAPDQIHIMAPMIIREIHYRLLIGPFGDHLKMINMLGTAVNQVAKAISWLRSNYKKDLYVDELAQQVGMSTSTFFRRFREVTSLSPIQYQKRLRLYEAQRLMMDENMSAGDASASVGYESLTQFSREYKRLFGEPPFRNTNKIRYQPQ